MKYATLGKTGLHVSRIGFGGIPVQRISEEEALQTLLCALEKGINFIDTARGYGISEKYIGKALQGKREKVILATKAPALTSEKMQEAVNGSLRDMQTEYIDLYQVHNVPSVKALQTAFAPQGAIEALEKAKVLGTVRHIGITSHKLEVLQYALDHYSDRFETIMYPYNIVELQGESFFHACKEKNIGVLAMKPLGGGNLEDARLALRFILQNHDVTLAIPGMASVDEVTENASVDDTPLSAEELAVCARLRETLGNDFCRRCGYCAPCTVGIDIPVMFTMYNYLERYHLPQWASGRYFANAKTAKDCIGCGVCETRCPYQLKIREKLQKVAKAFEPWEDKK